MLACMRTGAGRGLARGVKGVDSETVAAAGVGRSVATVALSEVPAGMSATGVGVSMLATELGVGAAAPAAGSVLAPSAGAENTGALADGIGG